MFLLLLALVFGQGPGRANQSPTLCKVESLPSDIQNRLKEEYGSWKIQESADLSQRAREAWEPGVLPVSLRKFVRQTTVFGSRGYDANTR